MVVVPGLVVSPLRTDSRLVNLVMGYCEGASALVGPLMASALIAIGGTRLALLVMAMLVSLCTISAWPLVRFDADVQPSAVVSARTAAARRRTVSRSLAERRGAKQLLLVLTAQYVLVGALDLICVVLADEAFGMGPAGPGLLSRDVRCRCTDRCGMFDAARRPAAPRARPAGVARHRSVARLVATGAWTVLGPVVVALGGGRRRPNRSST